LHLQASNTALQKQVAGEKETKVKLALELKDLHSQIQHMKIERNKLLHSKEATNLLWKGWPYKRGLLKSPPNKNICMSDLQVLY
jgi:hypothetical protein